MAVLNVLMAVVALLASMATRFTPWPRCIRVPLQLRMPYLGRLVTSVSAGVIRRLSMPITIVGSSSPGRTSG